MEKRMILSIVLFLNMIMVPLTSAVAIKLPMLMLKPILMLITLNVYVNAYQNVGDSEAGLGSFKKMGCPDGFFMFGIDPSRKCYKYINDKGRNWEDADKYCQDQGWRLAKPEDPVAIRAILVSMGESASGYVWIGARGYGTSYIWESDGQHLSIDDPLWLDRSVYYKDLCLYMEASKRQMSNEPDRPYSEDDCDSNQYALCEFA